MKNASSPRVMIQKLRSDSEPEPEPEPDASDVYRIDRVDGSLKIHAEFLAEYRCKKCAGLSKKERQSNCKDCKDTNAPGNAHITPRMCTIAGYQ